MARVKKIPADPPLRKKLVRVDPESESEFQYQPFENNNPLHIDDEIVRSIERDYGYCLQWCAETVLGQAQDESMASHRRNKFQEVRKGSFGGWLDFLCDREGRITKGGLVLMARPFDIEQMARAYEKKAARRAIDDMRRKHSTEGINVPGGSHPNAREHNRHSSHFERVPVPEQ